MNKSRFPANSYIGSLELRTVSEFIENDFHKILSGLISPGLIIRKLNDGVLDSPFRVYSSSADSGASDTITINPGLFIASSGGMTRIYEFKGMAFSASQYSPGTYNVCLVPNPAGHEDGLVTFTNGSDIVTITGGTFAHLRPYGYIIINAYETDRQGGGSFKVIEVSDTQARLSAPFSAANIVNAKWRVGARFPENSAPNEDSAKVLFEYNSCEIKLLSGIEGTLLATVTITRQGEISRAAVADKRADSLAMFKGNTANADDVTNGKTNSITTIEEKAKASRLDNIVKDYVAAGVKTGGSLTLDTTKRYLTIGALTAYDPSGRRIVLPANQVFDLSSLLSQGIIHQGINNLYIKYKSPNSYEFSWNIAEDREGHLVNLGIVSYYAGLPNGSHYASTAGVKKSTVKAISLISEGRSTPTPAYPLDASWNEGEIYYNPTDKLCYYVRRRADSSLEATKLINMDIISQQISAIRFQERLRFVLYPYEDKNNWFMNNGICAPIPVGYNYNIVQWKLGVLTTSNNLDDHSTIDYMSKLGTGVAVIAHDTCTWSSQVLRTKNHNNINLNSLVQSANTTLGVFYRGLTTGTAKKKIELNINGTVIDWIDMEAEALVADSGGGSPIKKLYSVELLIQSTTAVPQNQQEDMD